MCLIKPDAVAAGKVPEIIADVSKKKHVDIHCLVINGKKSHNLTPLYHAATLGRHIPRYFVSNIYNSACS